MKKTKLKQLIKEAFLTEQKNNLLNEGAPGFDSRKQGEALPTLESIKAAYQAKKLEEAGVEEITTVTKMTKPAEAAEIAKAEGTPKATVDAAIKKAKTSGKDVSIAEDTLGEDRFVDSSLEDLEQVVRNLAHTAGMSIEEAAEMAMMHIEDMFIGGEELDEGEDENDPGALVPVGTSTIYGTVKKYTELPNGRVKVDYDTGDTQVLQKERGVWVEVDYTVGKSTTTESKMEKELNYIYAREREHKERMRIANELFPEIAKEQEGGKLVNFIPLSDEQRDEVYAEYAKLNESVIAEADMIIESFRTKK